MPTLIRCSHPECQEEGIADCHDGRHLCEEHAKEGGVCLFCGEKQPEEVRLYEGLCAFCYLDAVKDEV